MFARLSSYHRWERIKHGMDRDDRLKSRTDPAALKKFVIGFPSKYDDPLTFKM
jgi:hypothetical protein